MFDKKKFKFLIEKAMRDRRISQYAEDSGVNRTYLSKYINQRLDNPPTPDILKRLSNASYGNVSYEEFMEVSGYIDNKITKDINTHEEYIINGEFGARLKLLRKEKGLTQKELAQKLNMQNTAISKYELNQRKPDTETLLEIANFFNVSVDYLLGNSDDRTTLNPKENTSYEKISELVKENEIKTLAAHFDGEDITDDDVEDIKNFIEFVIQKRKKKNK
ncbi:helix-turn-helix domain-containing protein [Clostridium sp. BJN0013]|uniref:helix-turn-helix domain-containing protein n=1 Tax=Clostridium sp. BJN0013 TaxID=3236840 RepID=UPI0034C64619